MPIETIKCKECGSADVTEFKPGSYVCGHCEAVFKHVDPSRLGLEQCQCGTYAVGRCAECNEPICGVHSGMIDNELLCGVHWPEREESRLKAVAATQLTVVKFVELAADAGNPGIRSWTIQRMGTVTKHVKTGRLKLGTYEFQSQAVVGSYILRGWIFPHQSWWNKILLTDDGRFVYASWFDGGDYTKSLNFENRDTIQESNVNFNWVGFGMTEPATINEVLRRLAMTIGLPIPDRFQD